MTTSEGGEPDPTPAKTGEVRFELRLTEQYQRTKRNVLFSTAIVIIIGFAGGSVTKLPIAENALPAAGALLLVWIASAFFLHEFAAEWRMTFVRNSVFAAGKTEEELDALISPGSDEKQIVSSLEASERAIESAKKVQVYPVGIGVGGRDRDAFLEQLNMLKVEGYMLQNQVLGLSILEGDVRAAEEAFIAKKASNLAAIAESLWYQVIGTASVSEASLEQTRSEIAALRALVPDLIHQDRKLVHRLDTLHRSIHSIQRRSIYIDRMVVGSMASLATVLTAYRGLQWFIDPNCSTFACPLLDWVT